MSSCLGVLRKEQGVKLRATPKVEKDNFDFDEK